MGEVNTKYIDAAGGTARVGGNESLYRRLLGKFEASVDVEGFDAAISANDFEEAGKIVHAAKGAAGNLSLTAFFDESVILMDQLRGGGKPQDSDVRMFRQLYEETKQAIKDYLDNAN
ncbi:MAG: Hpt domain-containing protein [Clostridiales Family XIII bacterium]|jgi:HPt (histidine-containing phosphotransfer) domain-containing protein|nr:Hpt domain-containing protein [Clostridiales Family XIII bacterium]